MTDPNRRSTENTLDLVPLDLLVSALGGFIAYGIVLASPSFQPDGILRELFLPAVIGSVAGLILLMLPGYAYVAAVFPNRQDQRGDSMFQTELTTSERVALSFGMSLSLVALVGLAMETFSIGHTNAIIGFVVAVGVFVGAAIGTARGHISLVKNPVKQLRHLDFLAGQKGGQSARSWAISAALAVSILLALSTLSLGLLIPSHGEAYTGFSVLVENEEGNAVAADYPTTIEQLTEQPMVVLIQNREKVDRSYTIVIEEERIERGSNDVAADNELIRVTMDVSAGDSLQRRVLVTPTMQASELRIAFFLYRGGAPADGRGSTAHRLLYLWVEDEAPEAAATT